MSDASQLPDHLTPTAIWTGGGFLDFADPRPEAIRLADIAVGLAMKPRWGGLLRDAYSVAEHSIAVARVARQIAPPAMDLDRLGLLALMHDATEAFMSDVSTPLKRLCPDYREIEHRLDAVIARRFGLTETVDPETLCDMRMIVRDADRIALSSEWHEFGPRGVALPGVPAPQRTGVFRCRYDAAWSFVTFAAEWGLAAERDAALRALWEVSR
ncbi:YfbR-like 5'-deoxynucleotidase [Tropicimonas sp. IMCC34043]|uniref:YfbR-like 5'-deoxynucleotidase n=1 Tax=Tropicimonas sp. IMCC34043 TaxID=2248760 RepID=UPI000E23808C|nr:YfbR-like 5'-deoxynucleotidase [Tropicimonas sp. IMCC34043]